LAAGAALHHGTRGADILPPGWAPLALPARAIADQNLLPLPESPGATPDPLPGWRVQLGNKRRQHLTWNPADPAWLRAESENTDEWFRIESPEIPVKPGMRFRFQTMVSSEACDRGAVHIEVTLWKQSDSGRVRADDFASDIPDSVRRGGWLLATETFTIPAHGVAMSVAITGTVNGSARFRDICLYRLE
jgi:hypothetical protein